MRVITVLCIFALFLGLLVVPALSLHNSFAAIVASSPPTPIILHDKNLKIETVFKGLNLPVAMAFLGKNDMLVVEKDKGTVRRIVNGSVLPNPLLSIPVANRLEKGLLGIAVAKHDNGTTYVFLYYTRSGANKTGDNIQGIKPLGSFIDRYELVNNKLVDQKVLLYINSTPSYPTTVPMDKEGNNHVGGKMIIGPDQNLYVIIGDMGNHQTLSENYVNGPPPDGTGGILKLTQDGQPVGMGIIGNKWPSNLYYAYGIRNGFGIDFDPVTGNLWDSEAGTSHGDEINMYKPGSNGGWHKILGFVKDGILPPVDPNQELVNFDGKGKYTEPKFVWYETVTPISVKFLNSDKLGREYNNDLFVSSYLGGVSYKANLYDFKLNQNRTDFILNGSLINRTANTPIDANPLIFATGFNAITDMQVGPDGYLYLLTLDTPGVIYRIVPQNK